MARAMDDIMTQFTKRKNKYATIDSGSEDVVVVECCGKFARSEERRVGKECW